MGSLEQIVKNISFNQTEWELIPKYELLINYKDDLPNATVVKKSISSIAQTVLSGEKNSEYIEFQMNRYYDGIDLSEKLINFCYKIENTDIGGSNAPINAYRNIDKIKFGWRLPEEITMRSNSVIFIILVTGKEYERDYILKTFETKFSVKNGFVCGQGIIKPDDNWFEQFLIQTDANIREKVEKIKLEFLSDFEITDEKDVRFIKNKPYRLGQFQNDIGFVNDFTNNLANYYNRANSYNKIEINTLLNNLATLNIEKVDILPTENISTKTIYLLQKTRSIENIYEEYLNIDGTVDGWEFIGTTEIDLTNYYTKDNIDSLFTQKIGNVPNVSTNDQTPTYTDEAVLEDLMSGEKLTSSFGKLKTAVKNLKTLIKLIGTVDISTIGDGTITGIITSLNNDIGAVGNGKRSISAIDSLPDNTVVDYVTTPGWYHCYNGVGAPQQGTRYAYHIISIDNIAFIQTAYPFMGSTAATIVSRVYYRDIGWTVWN